MSTLISLLAGGSVSAALTGLGAFAKDLREAITGKAILDPNKQAEIMLRAQEMEHTIILAAAGYDKAQMEAQLAVNKVEAQSSSTLKGGWRPATGWVCVLGLAYNFLLRPILPWMVATIETSPMSPMPPIEIGDLIVLLVGLLGLGGMRTLEKKDGVASK